MTTLEESQAIALEPVRRALLEAARDDAEKLRRSASAEAADTVGTARTSTAATLAQARAAGAEDAAEEIRANAIAAQRIRRGHLMEMRRRLYEEARVQAGEAVRALLQEPEIRATLTASLRHELGDTATVGPHPDGGLIAESPDGRRVLASVDSLVDAALQGLDVERLWSAP